MGLFGYTPSDRPRSNGEIKELKDGATELRARADRTAASGDPDGAERLRASADRNDADVAAELNRRKR
jgi:hypothetical protein